MGAPIVLLSFPAACVGILCKERLMPLGCLAPMFVSYCVTNNLEAVLCLIDSLPCITGIESEFSGIPSSLLLPGR